jgi:hypothetical protein
VAQLTEWLKLMVAEINRKHEDEARAREEELARQKEAHPPQRPTEVQPQRKAAG